MIRHARTAMVSADLESCITARTESLPRGDSSAPSRTIYKFGEFQISSLTRRCEYSTFIESTGFSSRSSDCPNASAKPSLRSTTWTSPLSTARFTGCLGRTVPARGLPCGCCPGLFFPQPGRCASREVGWRGGALLSSQAPLLSGGASPVYPYARGATLVNAAVPQSPFVPSAALEPGPRPGLLRVS